MADLIGEENNIYQPKKYTGWRASSMAGLVWLVGGWLFDYLIVLLLRSAFFFTHWQRINIFLPFTSNYRSNSMLHKIGMGMSRKVVGCSQRASLIRLLLFVSLSLLDCMFRVHFLFLWMLGGLHLKYKISFTYIRAMAYFHKRVTLKKFKMTTYSDFDNIW